MSLGSVHRILAIDDIPSNLLTLRAILPPDEFSFLGASGADDAFRLLDRQEFDLVLLDVLMPGLDGYAIARRLRSDPKTASVPVIFLTSLTDEDKIVQGFESGGVDFVSKPFHKMELLLRVRTHLALKDQNEALKRANQAREKFFSILAHDLKNPFSGIQSLIGGLLDHFDNIDRGELFDALRTMGDTAQNVSRLLETLLDWGRSQTGDLVLEPQPLVVKHLSQEALEPLGEPFRQKKISFIDRSTLDRIYGDRYTVVSILRNLLSNALKFTRPGGMVTLTSRRSAEAVEILVADNGIGIPPSRLSHLFQLDKKVTTPGTAREPGTGLGLILCQEFAQKNHGALWVESEPPLGTTFFLRLPAALS